MLSCISFSMSYLELDKLSMFHLFLTFLLSRTDFFLSTKFNKIFSYRGTVSRFFCLYFGMQSSTTAAKKMSFHVVQFTLISSPAKVRCHGEY